MIEFQQVSKSFGGQTVLADVSFQVNPREHAGIVGPNGAGKSTMFALIVGELTPDRGQVSVPRNARIGYLRQHIDPQDTAMPVLDYAENALDDIRAIEVEIRGIEDALHRGDAERRREPLLRRLGELQTRFESQGGYRLRNRAEAALCGLGFAHDSLRRPLASFSGGWQARADLARILVAEPDILLLDEPSNYLDIPAIEWLQGFLSEFGGMLVMVSHDRYLLNTLTRVTIEIAGTRVQRYGGNYDFYREQRTRRFAQALAAQRNQQIKREKMERFIERFRAKNTRATLVQSKIKALERMECVEAPEETVSPGRIRLRPPPHCGVEVLRLQDAGITYDGARWVLRHVDLRIQRGEKTALVGLNGMGKTTLLRLLAGVLPLSEGRRFVGHQVCIGYQSQDFAETMSPTETVFSTVKAAGSAATEREVRTMLGGFGFSGAAVEKPVQVLSGGEKIRLAFARLLIDPPNFLVLDEPTTHLDIAAREALEQALLGYEGSLYLVSHDIEFVRRVATGIIAMTPPGITRFYGGYDYYREKIASAEAAPTVPDPGSATQTQKTTPSNRKDLRRERAKVRQEMNEQTRELKKTIAKAEKQVDLFQTERDRLLSQIASSAEPVDYADVNRRLKTIQEEIERYTRKWEVAALALEELTGG